ncbi:MAG TPA: CPBP family intramembrane glutamic endopeptidase [Gammaproteobacteria bacterium]|nr:CPBP family intramembrane glutamic endopeptidase [Gammaproteobacteria bacterium]
MHERDVIPFFLMTFVIAWGILGLYILVPAAMGDVFGNLTGSHPLFYLAVYAPAISAVIMIIYRQGLTGVGRFLSRLLLWRTTYSWYLLLLVGMPLVFYLSALLKDDAYIDGLFPFASIQAYGLVLLLMAIKGPVEEIGWRGFALPLLQRRMAPLYAALLLGVIWAFWHLPAFLLGGTPQSAWSITPFFIGTIALSVIVTPLFNRSGGSILLAGIFHLQAINPLWPDAQPYDTWFFVGLAIVIVWLNRRTMLSRDGAVIEVVPQ